MEECIVDIKVEEHGWYIDVVPSNMHGEMARFTLHPILAHISLIHLKINKKFHGPTAITLAKASLDRISKLSPHLLIGVIPSTNRLACKFAEKLGFINVDYPDLFSGIIEPITGSNRLRDAKIYMRKI